jgi:hypothetical protein
MKSNLPVMVKMGRIAFVVLITAFIIQPVNSFSSGADAESFYSTAVLDFSERSRKQEGLGKLRCC